MDRLRLRRKNTKVAPDKYREEIQKIKAYIALNNVYGVDLNPTAVELGKLSLWLNVIHKDMQTPFFGYRLGVGNAVCNEEAQSGTGCRSARSSRSAESTPEPRLDPGLRFS